MLRAAVVAGSLLASACTCVCHTNREQLAHPTMQPEDTTSGLDRQVRAGSEGASGFGNATGKRAWAPLPEAR